MTTIPARHSLQRAVRAGIVAPWAAVGGLSHDDVRALVTFDPQARLLIRLRSAHGDGRLIRSALELFVADRYGSSVTVDGVAFEIPRDVRDVMAVATTP